MGIAGGDRGRAASGAEIDRRQEVAHLAGAIATAPDVAVAELPEDVARPST